jgi:nicotinamidase-related amidase
MLLNKETRPALLLVDIQQGFNDIEYWGGERNNPDAEKNAGTLLNLWRTLKLPIFHIKHCSVNPASRLAEGQPGNKFKEEVQPLNSEIIIKKNVNSAFIGTDLKQLLDKDHITQVVVLGITTDQCVSTTTRMAGNYGYDTYIVYDATATFSKKGFKGETFSAQLLHDTTLASLNGEFATVITTSQIIDKLSEE